MDNQPYATLLVDRTGSIVTITLNRPESGNAISREMADELVRAWRMYQADPTLRVAIITGAGPRHFCTGLDLESAKNTGGSISNGGPVRDSVPWSPVHLDVWKPVICALNGLVAGGGLHLVVDADIVVAGPNASVMDTHTTIGLVGAIENVGLLRRLPLGAALRLTLQGRPYRMSASRAYQLGLFDELCDDAEGVLECARSIAADIAANSPTAVSLSKQALWGAVRHLEAAQEHGWALARMHWAHPDFKEGPAAFRERRPPEWTESACSNR